MPDDSTHTIEYTLRYTGDQWDHEQLRSVLADRGVAIEAEAEVADDPIGPVDGTVRKTTWVDEGHLVAQVVKDGVTYVETYTHDTTEKIDEMEDYKS